MKQLLFLIFASSMLCVSCNKSGKESADSPMKEIVDNSRYQLFPTENIWTFLKLDTSNGKIWQVQYSVNNDYRGEVVLSSQALVEGAAAKNGRFTLYPTKNMFNFILLDQRDGRTWQVQWSTEEGNRMVIPIMR